MAFYSTTNSTPKTDLRNGQYLLLFTEIKAKKLKKVKDPDKDNGDRAEWQFIVHAPRKPGDGDTVTVLTGTWISEKSGSFKIMKELNGGEEPIDPEDRDSHAAFDWEIFSGNYLLGQVEINDAGYANVTSFLAAPEAMLDAEGLKNAVKVKNGEIVPF